MTIISLEELEFFAYHGFYEEERKVGNRYKVTVHIEINPPQAATTDDIHHTINYEYIYSIVKSEMAVPSQLLEHVVNRICEALLKMSTQVLTVDVALSKCNPPIGGLCKFATVRTKLTR